MGSPFSHLPGLLFGPFTPTDPLWPPLRKGSPPNMGFSTSGTVFADFPQVLVSADKTSVVSADKTSVVSADKTSVVSLCQQTSPKAASPTFPPQGRPRSGLKNHAEPTGRYSKRSHMLQKTAEHHFGPSRPPLWGKCWGGCLGRCLLT